MRLPSLLCDLGVVLCVVAACSSSPEVLVPEPPFVGITGGPLNGRLEPTIVDDVTGEPLDLETTLIFADGATRTVHPGIVDDPRLVPPLSISVASWRPQRWDGVGGARVVVGVAAGLTDELSARVQPPLGAEEARVRPIAPARLVRTEQFDRADSVAWRFDATPVALAVPQTASGAVAVLYRESEPFDIVPYGCGDRAHVGRSRHVRGRRAH